MEQVKEIIVKQDAIGLKILDKYELFKKEGKRLNKLERLTKYHNEINELWTSFLENNDNIADLGGADPAEPYIKDDYFGYIKMVYEDMMTSIKLKERLVRMKNNLPLGDESRVDNENDDNENDDTNDQTDEAATNSENEEESNAETPIRRPHSARSVYATPNGKRGAVLTLERRFIAMAENLELTFKDIDEKLDMELQEIAKLAFEECQGQWLKFKNLYDEISTVNVGNNRGNFDEFNKLREQYLELMRQVGTPDDRKAKAISAMPLKLDAIKIPKFHGTYEAWPTFSSLFRTLIIANKTINDIQRMQYLKSVVSGEAERAINNLDICEENFDKAWYILESRFNNRQAIIDKHLRGLINMEPLHVESGQRLRRLQDSFKEYVALLDKVSQSELLIHIMKSKLSDESRTKYEEQRSEDETLEKFFDFLNQRCRVIESKDDDKSKRGFKNQKFKREAVQIKADCSCCSGNHPIFFCEKFKEMKINERKEVVRQKALRLLCLRPNHNAAECTYKKMCPTCNKRHNGLLHYGDANEPKRNEPKSFKRALMAVTSEEVEEVEHMVACPVTRVSKKREVFLATALVRVRTSNGWSEPLRAMIDGGATGSFCADHVVTGLNLKRRANSVQITGIDEIATGSSLGSVDINFTARYPTSFNATTSAVILGRVMSPIPLADADKDMLKGSQLEHLILADPEFWKKSRVDLVLGSDVYGQLILGGLIKTPQPGLIAQESEIGWLLSGPGIVNNDQHKMVCMVSTKDDLEDNLKRIWDMDDEGAIELTKDEREYCEKQFEATVERDLEGRYVLALPFRENCVSLGNSKRSALAQLLQTEKRFETNEKLRQDYVDFMREYIQMGHMIPCDSDDASGEGCYLPHHAVYKKDSTTTKTRIVFDASRKTSNGYSLNDKLVIGPKLQDDLCNILLRFRTHKIAFCADIAKMYRQINIRSVDQKYQKVLWRENPNEPIIEYKLATVTYGTGAAPFMAVKTVQYHADSEAKNYPEACEILKKDLYMDDVSSGTNTLEKAIRLQREVTDVLAMAGMPLRKWISNSAELLKHIPQEQREGAPVELGKDENFVSTLGLLWFHENDKLGFKVRNEEECKKLTKRVVLSEISKIYDPLGILAPITVANKILMKQIWEADIRWDDAVPKDIATRWNKVREQLQAIAEIRFNRWINYEPGDIMELVGFADASMKAYAAVIYSLIRKQGKIFVEILTAKTRIAKKGITLPKLELSAAVLLAKLMNVAKNTLSIPIAKKTYYSDSEVTLAWLKKDPSKWKTFVANRVAVVQSLTVVDDWKYVSTKQNSADCASRGLFPKQLVNHDLWWHGPQFLHDNLEMNYENDFDTELEKKNEKVAMNVVSEEEKDIFNRVSTLKKAVRVIAWCKRAANKAKKNAEPLETDELSAAKMVLISMCQAKYFSDELAEIREKGSCARNSKLKTLCPFIDGNGILRVGGRLQNSEFDNDKKHPVIIPYGSKLAEWIMDDAHKRVLHGGNQLTLAQIRHEFWIIAAKRAVKTHINRCVICHRFKAKAAEQLMGSLPQARTKIVSKVFTHTGTDLCGPVQMKMSTGRGQRVQKGYIVIFICMSTRAIHIEIVSDLSAEAFIAAFKRFVGRRGNVEILYSDNGLNFVAANKILQLESEQAIKDYQLQVKNGLTQFNTKFQFNPPSAPWFGGIWERNIGSIKYHLKRVVRNRVLTYEELSTILCQVEACVNSRPMWPLSEDPNEVEALTPGHFLVGGALTAPLECSLIDTKENKLNRWELCSRLKQEFWSKWSSDYISLLQKRNKWTNIKDNLRVGDLVLIMDEVTAPLRWPLARITKIFTGSDGLVRVAEVRSKGKIYKRPIGKLSPLPTNNETNDIQSNDKQMKVNEQAADVLKKPKKGGKTAKMTSLKGAALAVVTLLALINWSSAQTLKYQLDQFSSNTSVYMEKCDEVMLSTNDWNLMLHFGVDDYFEEMNQMQTMANDVRKNCENRKNATNSACILLEHVNDKVMLLTAVHEIIKTEWETRKKRSVLAAGIVGMIAGVVGTKVMDWMKFEEKDDYVEALAENEISVLELIDSKMHSITQNINTAAVLEREMYEITLMVQKLTELEKKQNKLVTILTEKGTTVTSDLIPLDELLSHFKIIATKIDIDSLYGKTITAKTLNIYKLAMKTKVVALRNSIIVLVKIPLIQSKFECRKIYPLQFIHENKTMQLDLKYEYVLFNEGFILMTETDMQRCASIDNKKICSHQKIVKNTTATCEYNLINDKHDGCLIKTIAPQQHWIKLNNANEWILDTLSETSVKLICEDYSKSLTIATSKIWIAKNCNIESNEMKIIAENAISTEIDVKNRGWKTLTVVAGKTSQLDTNDVHEKIAELRFIYKNHVTGSIAFAILFIINVIVVTAMYIKVNHDEKVIRPNIISRN